MRRHGADADGMADGAGRRRRQESGKSCEVLRKPVTLRHPAATALLIRPRTRVNRCPDNVPGRPCSPPLARLTGHFLDTKPWMTALRPERARHKSMTPASLSQRTFRTVRVGCIYRDGKKESPAIAGLSWFRAVCRSSVTCPSRPCRPCRRARRGNALPSAVPQPLRPSSGSGRPPRRRSAAPNG